MVETEEASPRSTPPSSSPPPPPPPPPPVTSIPSSSPCSVSRHDQIATIKRNLNFLQRATQQPPPVPTTGILPQPPPLQPLSTASVSSLKSSAIQTTQPLPSRHDCYVSEPSWITFRNHFQVTCPPPGYNKNSAPVFPCPPPPLGIVDIKNIPTPPPPIRRPSAETVESAASFEFALEAERMVSELCSSSKDFSEKSPAIGTDRFEISERSRQTEPWSIKAREICTHDTDDYNQTLQTSSNPNDNITNNMDLNIQLPCIYEDDLCLRDFISKGCLEFDNILKSHKRNSQLSDLIGFSRMIRESAENPSAYELHHDEARSQILTFFRLASSWLNIYPLVERAGMPKDGFRPLMYRYFNDWQVATRRMMELIVKNAPSLKERLDCAPGADLLAYGDQCHKRQPFPQMHYDSPRISMDNLKRQRSVPNVQGHHRQWRQRRFSDNHNDGENHGFYRNNLVNPKDMNNRNKWTIVSPDVYHYKPQFRKPDMQNPLNSRIDFQDNSDNRGNRYTSKIHSPECTPGRPSVFNDDDRMAKWPKYHTYPAMEVEIEAPYKMPEEGNQNVGQNELAQHNHMVLLSQIEPRCVQKHTDQQPVDLDALFQGYRIANEAPEKSGLNNRQTGKVPPNQGQMRYSSHDNKFNTNPIQGQPNRGRRWYNNYNFCPPPWVTHSNYEPDHSDDPHDGVYMKPGSYDVPKRNQKPPPIPPPVPPVIIPTTPTRFKPGPPDEVTWQAALASAETLCKSLRSNDNQAPHPDAQQQWMIRTIRSSSSSESDVTEVQSHPDDPNEVAAATAAAATAAAVAAAVAVDVATSKTVVKKLKSSRERKSLSKTARSTPPPPTPPPPPPPPISEPSSSPPPLTSPPLASSPSQPLSSRRRSLSPSSSRRIQRFLETVWAVKEASHVKFPPDPEHSGVDGKKVLEDTFQRLLDDGWAAREAATAAAAAAALNRRQTKQ